MLCVDDVSQVLAVDFLLKDPHLDLIVKMVEASNVATNDLCNGRTPNRSKMERKNKEQESLKSQ